MEGTVHTGYHDGHGMSRIKQDLDSKVHQDPQEPTSKDMLRTATARARQVSVGIVGAGFAGLRCADVLLQHGVKVTIFEARDRVGGRVAQSDHLGHTVDLGPNWIHGTVDNPIMRLAQETGTTLHGWDESSVVFDSAGQPLRHEEVAEYAELQWDDGFIADAFRYSNAHNDEIDPKRSLYDFFIEKADGAFKDLPVGTARRKRATLLQIASMWGAYVGSAVTRQSLKFFWLEECIEGENPFVAGTYRRILEAVAESAREKAKIHLNTAVRHINLAQASSDGSPSSRPSLETDSGSPFEFDEVVVTAPLGWLKRNKTTFRPGLNQRLSEAIDNVGYGTLDKVYITFPKAFWESPGNTSVLASNGPISNNKTPNVTATTAPLHQPSASEAQSHYTGFVQWLDPDYSDSNNPKRWGQQGMNLAALPADCSHPTILFYTYGECSVHIASLIRSSKSVEAADKALLDFFEPYYSLLPNYDPASPECRPKAVLATAWANDEFAGYGSYTNFQVGVEQGDEDIKTMRHGMPEQSIWFAGEHTAPFVAMGTSTGAYWSGEGVAERILQAYGLAEQVGGEGVDGREINS